MRKKEIYLIVQARMGSTRLPGKIMKKILGKPMLWHQLQRLKKIDQVSGIVVATSDKQEEAPLVDMIQTMPDINLFRGDEKDVLSRYFHAAQSIGAEVIVRITADCPLIDPIIVRKVVDAFFAEGEPVDYVSNILTRTYPKGLDTEVFSMKTLVKVFQEAQSPYDREHVTPYIYQNPQQFHLKSVASPVDYSALRWTVDTPVDFELISHIYGALYPTNSCFGFEDILKLLDQQPQWREFNTKLIEKVQ